MLPGREISGHLDEVRLAPGARLFLPGPRARVVRTLKRQGRLERDETLVSIFSRSRYDCVEELLYTDLRYETQREGRSEVALTTSLRERYYAPPEFRLLLEVAGFVDIEVHGNHTEEPACSGHQVVVFGATRA